ncbi:2683_t:CDS:2, partial [Paraglomus occultum]
VDLKGVSEDKLKSLPDNGPISDLKNATPAGTAYKYKDYVKLNAAGDGNCFLNSFSVFLTGKNGDASLALPLRVKEVREKSVEDIPQIILTRADDLFIRKLLAQEIPQIKEGVIAIRDILRLPGLVSKVMVERGKVAMEKGLKLDPAGTCIGEEGEKAKSVSRLIYPERIDFADWTEDKKRLLPKLLSPASPNRPAQGVVVDSYPHPQTNSQISELLVRDGELRIKDTIFLNGKFGQVKMMLNIRGQKITTAHPSDIVQIVGLNIPAELGDKFVVVNDEKTTAKIENDEKKNVNLVLSADSQNSLEALSELIRKKNTPNFNFSIVYTTVGNLNSFALDLTKITSSTVLIFGYQPPQQQASTLKENNIPFFSSKIIYEIGEKLAEIINRHQEIEEIEEVVGTALVKVVFEFSKGNIAGCQVTSGKISRNKRVYVLQGKEEKKVFVGEIKSLESNKVEKNEVSSGQECGIVLKGFDKFQEGDKIIAFHLIKKNVIQ